MTTWTANKKHETSTSFIGGDVVQKTYKLTTGVAGDTGGTLTCTGLKSLYDCHANAQVAASGVATYARISGKTVIVSYANPAADHSVYITVWGIRG